MAIEEIKKIKAAEVEAEAIINRAKEEAEQAVLNVREDREGIIEEAKAKAVEESFRIIEEAKKKAQEEVKEIKARIAHEKNEIEKRASSLLKKAVEVTLNRIKAIWQ